MMSFDVFCIISDYLNDHFSVAFLAPCRVQLNVAMYRNGLLTDNPIGTAEVIHDNVLLRSIIIVFRDRILLYSPWWQT